MKLSHLIIAIAMIPFMIAGSAVITILSYLLIPMTLYAILAMVFYTFITEDDENSLAARKSRRADRF